MSSEEGLDAVEGRLQFAARDDAAADKCAQERFDRDRDATVDPGSEIPDVEKGVDRSGCRESAGGMSSAERRYGSIKADDVGIRDATARYWHLRANAWHGRPGRVSSACASCQPSFSLCTGPLLVPHHPTSRRVRRGNGGSRTPSALPPVACRAKVLPSCPTPDGAVATVSVRFPAVAPQGAFVSGMDAIGPIPLDVPPPGGRCLAETAAALVAVAPSLESEALSSHSRVLDAPGRCPGVVHGWCGHLRWHLPHRRARCAARRVSGDPRPNLTSMPG
jgi:hypothetical protein